MRARTAFNPWIRGGSSLKEFLGRDLCCWKATSGSGTVQGKLAVASGMTSANVALFAPLVEHTLVSTGVSLDEHRLDPAKLRESVSEVRRARPA